MKKTLFILCNVFVLIMFCIPEGQARNQQIIFPGDSISVPDIQGAWKCVNVNESYPVELDDIEVPGLSPQDLPTIVFEKDSMWTFVYPCLLLTAAPYKLVSNCIQTNNSFDNTNAYQVKIVNDTLVLNHTNYKGAVIRQYVRTTTQSQIISSLKRDTINIECLPGKWRYVSPGNGHGENPPAEISKITPPEIISISVNDIPAISNNIILLAVGGKNREYKYGFVLNRYELQLCLEPVVYGKGFAKDERVLFYYKRISP